METLKISQGGITESTRLKDYKDDFEKDLQNMIKNDLGQNWMLMLSRCLILLCFFVM